MTEPQTTTELAAPRFVQMTEVGDSLYGAFVICRGCGSAIAYLHQGAMRTHLDVCEPLRRTR